MMITDVRLQCQVAEKKGGESPRAMCQMGEISSFGPSHLSSNRFRLKSLKFNWSSAGLVIVSRKFPIPCWSM